MCPSRKRQLGVMPITIGLAPASMAVMSSFALIQGFGFIEVFFDRRSIFPVVFVVVVVHNGNKKGPLARRSFGAPCSVQEQTYFGCSLAVLLCMAIHACVIKNSIPLGLIQGCFRCCSPARMPQLHGCGHTAGCRR